jgi:AraC-like DNA-binding protein
MPRIFLELGADQDPVFPLPDLRAVESLLRQLEIITVGEPPAQEVRSSGLLTLVLAELFASRAERTKTFSLSQATKPLSESVRKGIDYMTRFYDLQMPVKHIAQVSGQSLYYFSRRFHQEMAVSPIEYLNRYRIEQAKKLLASSNQGIEQIARSVGFRNHNYFTRTFVRFVGHTPLAYRKTPTLAAFPLTPTRPHAPAHKRRRNALSRA